MKKLLLLSVLSLFTFSCNDEDVVQESEKNQSFVKLSFINTDDSFEDSRIIRVVDLSAARTNQNLVIDSDITLSEGDYGVVEVSGDPLITITGIVRFGNINTKNQSAIRILNAFTGQLTIASSFNLNGDDDVLNYGILNTGNVEMQGNDVNKIVNKGVHNIDGDFQILNPTSTYTNCGTLNVSKNTNFNQGHYIACDCGQLITDGLNVNRDNIVSGIGSITVRGNLNMNHNLTESNKIEFIYCDGVYPRPFKNQEAKNLGFAVRVCAATCTPPSLPIKYTNLAITRTGNKLKISFDIQESSDMKGMRVLYSKNAITWREIYVEQPEKLVPNSKYEQYVDITTE
jgi:hypothetical protein